MCIMPPPWLTLSLLVVLLHRPGSSHLRIFTFFYTNKTMLRISAFRLGTRTKLPVPLLHSPPESALSQTPKSQIYNHTQRAFSLYSNPKIPKHFEEKIARRLDTSTSNPIGIVAQLVRDFFNSYDDAVIEKRRFNHFAVEFKPISITENFDELQVPLDHVSRNPSDTYYLSEDYSANFRDTLATKYVDIIKSDKNGVFSRELIDKMGASFDHSQCKLLPTHTTSHITKLLRQDVSSALYSGQVFRRDEVDSQHYPVFHQMDGYLLFTREDVDSLREKEEYQGFGTDGVIMKHLKNTLEHLVEYLYGFVKYVPKTPTDFHTLSQFSALKKTWDDKATFPFTFPSSEYYVENEGEMTELLGCGVLKNIILENNLPDFGKYVGGWAFGIGLERMAMVLCKIFDIRQFWETDERFTRQYRDSYSRGLLPVFSKYSKNPPVVRDLSFYLSDSFDEALFRQILLENGGGYLEEVEFVSSYFNEKLNKKSLCYRVVYRAFEENLTNSFVNSLHDRAVRSLEQRLGIIVR